MFGATVSSLSSVSLIKREWCTELMIRSGKRGEVKTEEDISFEWQTQCGGDVTAVGFNTKVGEKEELFNLKKNVKIKADENKLITGQFRGEIRRSLKSRNWVFWNRFCEK